MFDKEGNPEEELYVLSMGTYDLGSRLYNSDLLDSATSWYRSMDALSGIVHFQINTMILVVNSNLAW
jgi:hypothetical protein